MKSFANLICFIVMGMTFHVSFSSYHLGFLLSVIISMGLTLLCSLLLSFAPSKKRNIDKTKEI